MFRTYFVDSITIRILSLYQEKGRGMDFDKGVSNVVDPKNGRSVRQSVPMYANISNLIVFPSYQIGLEIVQAVDVARVVGLERSHRGWPTIGRILNGSLTDSLSVIGSLHVVSSHSYLVNPCVRSAAVRPCLKARFSKKSIPYRTNRKFVPYLFLNRDECNWKLMRINSSSKTLSTKTAL